MKKMNIMLVIILIQLTLCSKVVATIIGNDWVDPGVNNTYIFNQSNVDLNQPIDWSIATGAVIVSSSMYVCTIKTDNQNVGLCGINLTVSYTNTSGLSVSEYKTIYRFPFMTGPQIVYPGESFTYSVMDPCHNFFSCNYNWGSSTGSSNYSSVITWNMNNVSVQWPSIIPSSTLSSGIIGHVRCYKSCSFGSYSANTSDYIISMSLRPPTITGPTSTPCGSLAPITYTAGTVTGTTASAYYQWIIPIGWSGTSNTNTITVTPNGTNGGIISVRVFASSAVNSSAGSMAISLQEVMSITGSSILCPGTSGNYISLSSPAGLTGNYTWTTNTPGWLINNSVSPFITTSNTVTVKAPLTKGFTSLCVSTSSDCPAICYTLSNTDLAAPTYLTSNPTSGCKQNDVDWYIAPVPNATSYTWSSTSSGIVLIPNSTRCVIVITSSGPGAKTIKVKANNQCGSSPWRQATLVVKPPVDCQLK